MFNFIFSTLQINKSLALQLIAIFNTNGLVCIQSNSIAVCIRIVIYKIKINWALFCIADKRKTFFFIRNKIRPNERSHEKKMICKLSAEQRPSIICDNTLRHISHHFNGSWHFWDAHCGALVSSQDMRAYTFSIRCLRWRWLLCVCVNVASL